MNKLLSINISEGDTIQIGRDFVNTGILKKSVDRPVTIGRLGLEGDHIADLRHHGGPDQAVYLYSQEDYDWWSAELGRTVPIGTFGENLTVSAFGAASEAFKPGDRFTVGDVLLEVTCGRIPCSKLGAVMGDQKFVKRFARAHRPGLYVRVLITGNVEVGDEIVYQPTPEDYPTVLELYDLFYTKEPDLALIKRCLAAPMDERGKGYLREMMEKNDE